MGWAWWVGMVAEVGVHMGCTEMCYAHVLLYCSMSHVLLCCSMSHGVLQQAVACWFDRGTCSGQHRIGKAHHWCTLDLECTSGGVCGEGSGPLCFVNALVPTQYINPTHSPLFDNPDHSPLFVIPHHPKSTLLLNTHRSHPCYGPLFVVFSSHPWASHTICTSAPPHTTTTMPLPPTAPSTSSPMPPTHHPLQSHSAPSSTSVHVRQA